jgi:hypothetical protein
MSDEEEDGYPRNQSTPRSSPITYSIKMVSSPSDLVESTTSEEQAGRLNRRDGSMETYIPPSDSDESLSIVTKDSIEDLPSATRRSPRSSKFPANVHGQDDKGGRGGSPAASPPLSPRRRLKKKLTVNIDGAEFNLGHKKRPLSPFTSSGMLRKFTGGVPPSAPAAVTEFGPTLEDEVQEKMKLEEQKSETLRRTTRAERGGKSLMSFLGRRLGSA